MTSGRTALALVAAVQVLALSTWFAASAAAPALRAEWDLDPGEVALLTVAVQVGFVAGALVSAVLNLPDRVHAARLMAVGALGAALGTAAVAVLAHGLASAVLLRGATGACLAAVYPVGLKVVSSWFRAGRGLALGVLVGALTLGSTLPQVIGGSLGGRWRAGLLVAAGLATLAAALALRCRSGPYTTPATRLEPALVLGLLRRRGPLLANLGYFGHMWELYAVWTWLPAFLAASAEAARTPLAPATRGLVVFATLGLCGALGCVLAGRLGDRVGRARVAAVAMVGSGTCCLLAAALFGRPLWLLVPVLALWGATVIADSAMFSACTTLVVDPRHTGTALTFQTAVGFLVTVVTIEALPLAAAAWGWPLAVAGLALGPLLGAVAMLRLSPLLTAAPSRATHESEENPCPPGPTAPRRSAAVPR